MAASSNISPDFPFKSKYLEVHGPRIHTVGEGSGAPLLFLRGIPFFKNF